MSSTEKVEPIHRSKLMSVKKHNEEEPQAGGLSQALDNLVEVLGSGDFARMEGGLEGVLAATDTESLRPALIVLDENGSPQMYVPSPGGVRNFLEDERRLKLLAGGAASTPQHSLTRQLFNDLVAFARKPNQAVAWIFDQLGEEAAAELKLELEPSHQDSLTNWYRPVAIILDAKGSLKEAQEKLEPVFIDPAAIFSVGGKTEPKPQESAEYRQRHVVVARQWPDLSPGAPKPLIIAGFSPRYRGESLAETIENLGPKLDSLLWPMQMAAFIFQSYAQANASSREIQPTAEESRYTAMLKLFKKSETLEQLRTAARFLFLMPIPLATRVLRSWAPEEPKERILNLLRILFEKLFDGDLPWSSAMPARPLLAHLGASEIRQWYQQDIEYKLPDQLFKNVNDEELLPALLDVIDEISASLSKRERYKLFELVLSAAEASGDRFVSRLLASACHLASTLDFASMPNPLKQLGSIMLRCGWRDLPTAAFSFLTPSQRLDLLDYLQLSGTSGTIVCEQVKIHFRGLQDQERFDTPALLKERGIVTVLSSKGGVGKSIVSLGLASILRRRGRVCWVDLDISGPTLSTGLNSCSTSPVSLNEALVPMIWPYLAQEEKKSLTDRRKALFTQLSTAPVEELIDQILIPAPSGLSSLENVDLVTCSMNPELQDPLISILMAGKNLFPLKRALQDLVDTLLGRGYDFVVFDTPAELKEISLCSATVTAEENGLNIFVGTLFRPSLQPLPALVATQLWSSNTAIVVNKVRAFDKHLVENIDAFSEYLASLSAGTFGDLPISPRLISSMLKLARPKLASIPWASSLERFFQRSGSVDAFEDGIREASQRLEELV